ncbi:MAG: carboxymuconolactone decarboxylase family protein [Chloroflexi bacterium]|nr:carboxymuconolactone decarboxylase family protein [Chloroflexota bacterium]
MFAYPFTNEIGAGDIPQDLQDAIWREINYRLGEGDAPGPLTPLEKSLILVRISAAMLNSMRTHLYCLAALKAGATLDQVTEACVSVVTVGMLRWKMASMDSLSCAEAWAKQRNLSPRTPSAPEEGMEKRIGEMRAYIRKVLSREFPDMWERLAEVAPFALDGYMRMRGGILRTGAAIPKRIKELLVVGSDIVQGNAWGAGMHAGQAIRDGATVAQVVDTVALTMMEIGQSAYRIGGMDAIQGAREAAAKTRAK